MILQRISVVLMLAIPCSAAEDNAAGPERTTSIASAGWSTWKKFNQPVFSGQYPVIGDPCVLREGRQLRMYYTGFDPDKQGPEICQALSVDGRKWEYARTGDDIVKGRVLRAAKDGKWKDTHETCFALKWRGEYQLYFCGYKDKGGGFFKSFPSALGMATSRDGNEFRETEKPVINGTPDGYDHDGMCSPSVVEHSGRLFMVYAGFAFNNKKGPKGAHLLGATSSDGVVWTKHATHLFDRASMPAFFKEFAAEPELVKGPDGAFYLFFSAVQGDDPHMIGVARSNHPFGPWEFRPEPVVRATPETFDAAGIVAPSVLIEDGKVRLWYSGFSKNKTIAIGYAEAPWPLKTVK